MEIEDWETTDVVICGCGPTGAMLSAYLGRMSVPNVVLEREADINTDPRGIALDEDGIRFLQGVGIYDSIFSEIGSCMGRFNFIGGTESVLKKSPFLALNYSTTAGGTGHIGFISHKQPILEKNLRKAMSESEYCILRSESTVYELCEDNHWTYCKYRDAQGTERRIRARFFVGADGKTGFTRKQYLEPKGVHMEKVTDMAKLTFPVGGQGIASGFRDAASLAWRLALLCHHHPTTPKFHEQVLAAWYQERKQQLEKSLATTIENGKFVCEANSSKIFIRDWYLWLAQLVPSWKRHLQLGRRKDGMIRYVHSDGMPFMPDLNGGLNLPQVFCKDMTGNVLFTDDVIFHSKQKSIFRLFVYLRNDEELARTRAVLREVEELSQSEFAADQVPFVIEDITKRGAGDDKNVFQIASAEEFARSPLCKGRPEPTYYEPFLMRTEVRAKYIIVRPDRVVFAACEDEQSLKTAIEQQKLYLLLGVTVYDNILHVDQNMENPEGEMSDPCLYTAATTHSFMGSVKDATHCMINHDEAWANSRHIEGKPECWQTASGTGPEQSEAQIPTIDTEEYLDFRPMLYRSDKLLETYEKVSCTLFTLHRKRTIPGESAACVYTIDGLFQCVSTLCDLLETTVPAANALIDRASYITNNGIFKLGLMEISIALEIYENLLHNYQRVSCPEDFSGEKTSHDVVQLSIASDTMELANIILRCTFMDIHLRRLQTTLEAASLELSLTRVYLLSPAQPGHDILVNCWPIALGQTRSDTFADFVALRVQRYPCDRCVIDHTVAEVKMTAGDLGATMDKFENALE
ncbi:hypothetical protein APSETT445_006390 [Aspergillus pseudonomiae]